MRGSVTLVRIFTSHCKCYVKRNFYRIIKINETNSCIHNQ